MTETQGWIAIGLLAALLLGLANVFAWMRRR